MRDADATRTFLRNERTEPERPSEKTPAAGETTVPPVEQHDEHAERRMRSTGDRVRVLGSVHVGRDEEVSGQVVAVLGSVHIADAWHYERRNLIRLTRRAFATVAHSRPEKQWLEQRGAERVRVIPEGIDPESARGRPGAFRSSHGIVPSHKTRWA